MLLMVRTQYFQVLLEREGEDELHYESMVQQDEVDEVGVGMRFHERDEQEVNEGMGVQHERTQDFLRVDEVEELAEMVQTEIVLSEEGMGELALQTLYLELLLSMVVEVEVLVIRLELNE